MSDTLDAAPTTATDAAGPLALANVAATEMSSPRVRDLTRWAQGFSFIFWGLLALSSTIPAALYPMPTLPMDAVVPGADAAELWRMCVLIIGCTGVLGVVAGSWRLYQTKGAGREWKGRTGGLLAAAVLVGYLFPFFCMWSRVPTNLYLLCHVLIWIGALIGYLSLLSLVVNSLAKLTGQPSLALQAVIYGGLVFLVLFTLFALIAPQLILVTWRGQDPLMALQFLLVHTQFAFVVVTLIPLALTLSLAWTAKDIALRQLMAADAGKTTGSDPA